MIDVIYAVSMFLSVVLVAAGAVYIYRKNQVSVVAPKENARERLHNAAAAAAPQCGDAGRMLQVSAEELDKNLDRLCLLFTRGADFPKKGNVTGPKPPGEAPKGAPNPPVETAEPPEEISKPPADLPKYPARYAGRAGSHRTEPNLESEVTGKRKHSERRPE